MEALGAWPISGRLLLPKAYGAARVGKGTLAPSRASPARSEAPPITSVTNVATAE